MHGSSSTCPIMPTTLMEYTIALKDDHFESKNFKKKKRLPGRHSISVTHCVSSLSYINSRHNFSTTQTIQYITLAV